MCKTHCSLDYLVSHRLRAQPEIHCVSMLEGNQIKQGFLSPLPVIDIFKTEEIRVNQIMQRLHLLLNSRGGP